MRLNSLTFHFHLVPFFLYACYFTPSFSRFYPVLPLNTLLLPLFSVLFTTFFLFLSIIYIYIYIFITPSVPPTSYPLPCYPFRSPSSSNTLPPCPVTLFVHPSSFLNLHILFLPTSPYPLNPSLSFSISFFLPYYRHLPFLQY